MGRQTDNENYKQKDKDKQVRASTEMVSKTDRQQQVLTERQTNGED